MGGTCPGNATERAVDLYRTVAQLDSRSFYREVRRLPVKEYDLVITDFEPVSAWACMLAKKHCVGLSNQGHYTLYLPAHDDLRILNTLTNFRKTEWQVFSKHSRQAFRHRNVSIQPIQDEAFLKSMASSAGVLCAAGFGTPSEVLYLQKNCWSCP